MRVVGSASGATSRTRPVALKDGSSSQVTVKVAAGGRAVAIASGTSITASRTSGRAMVTTVCPAVTTWPTSALADVTTPSTVA